MIRDRNEKPGWQRTVGDQADRDLKFFDAVLASLKQDYRVDGKRIYATGHSNGAMMAYRLAAEAAEKVAAIAPVAGMMVVERFAPARPVPVLHIHSVDDPRALYTGGLGPPFPGTQSRVVHCAVEGEIWRWVAHDCCFSELWMAEQRTAPARGGTEVQLWRLTGAGHGWPGSHVRLPEKVMGPDTVTIDAALEAWRFLARFRRPDAPPLEEP